MKNIRVILAITVLVTVACVCGGTPTTPPEKIRESTNAPSAPTIEIYKVGDVIQTGSSTIVLNTAIIQNNSLHANFTVENNGTTDLNVSSLVSFTAKGSDGTKLQQEYFDCESGGLDGTVLPGDKLRGNICWSGVASDTVKIYYESNLFGGSSSTVVWEISR